MSLSTATTPKVTIETPLGPIIVELYPQQAPLTVANFLQYCQQGLFANSSFFRIVNEHNAQQAEDANASIQVIQGGLAPGDKRLLPPIAHESTEQTGLLHEDGVISMARFEPGTADGSFFFCIGEQPALNFAGKRYADGLGFAAFGRIISGRQVLEAIYHLAEDEEYLKDEISIISIYQI
ncbi:peptidylprolyl isomerase [Dasania marina]|uniref:peptidylprolyl isomerase n=1 Tax=Dasania marina TaxID=471499 RepID=UPI00036ADFE6|nr:peptidylprolyl isomerase [Dasania marina]